MRTAPSREGSTRRIEAYQPGKIPGRLRISFCFDDWSAFDRGPTRRMRCPQPIPGIDKARAACACLGFAVAKQAGIRTHFLEQLSETAFLVQEFTVDRLPLLSGHGHGRVLPLEIIFRLKVEGSLYERLMSGEVSRKDVGLPVNAPIMRGMKLPKLYIECTTKLEKVDRPLSPAQALALARITNAEWLRIKETVTHLVLAVRPHYAARGWDIPDGKVEVALTHAGEVVIVDTFFTQDENRIIKVSTGQLFSKDLIRVHFNANEPEWKMRFLEAKRKWPMDKAAWPEYPQLPHALVELVSLRYAEVARI